MLLVWTTAAAATGQPQRGTEGAPEEAPGQEREGRGPGRGGRLRVHPSQISGLPLGQSRAHREGSQGDHQPRCIEVFRVSRRRDREDVGAETQGSKDQGELDSSPYSFLHFTLILNSEMNGRLSSHLDNVCRNKHRSSRYLLRIKHQTPERNQTDTVVHADI